MILRPYQSEGVTSLRPALAIHRAVCRQLATGGGKTAEFSEITRLASEKNRRVWIVVPRNQLLRQASAHLRKYQVPHGIISANSAESSKKVHVVSKDTLIRRYDKIKNWPDLLIFDECHLYFDRQIEIVAKIPLTSKVIGFTATPERLSGKGLSALYGALIEGPPIEELIAMGFLAIPKYFAPMLSGLKNLKRNAGEFDSKQLTALLAERKIYGKVVDHYKEEADGKSALVFCRSIDDARRTATEFADRDYIFENVDGKMSAKKQNMLFNALRNREIQGLTTCELAIYGLDIPQIECLIMLRPTMSLAYYLQMLGRGLRPCDEIGKTHCVILDHVNNLLMHTDSVLDPITKKMVPGDPFGPRTWNFDGTQKRRKKPDYDEIEDAGSVCSKCKLYLFGKTVCPNCGETKTVREPADLEIDESQKLQEIKPLKLNDRPPEERREYIDRINEVLGRATQMAGSKITGENTELAGIVADMLKIAEELKNQPMWAYWRLSEGKRAVNVPVLHEIARQKEYKSGWVRHKIDEIKRK